jgi:gamma-glutamyltranspeptidase/glutathione hydrolase
MLSERFGKLPFAELFDAAIHYAEDGFQVGPITAYYWDLAQELYKDFPEFAAEFSPAPRHRHCHAKPGLGIFPRSQ